MRHQDRNNDENDDVVIEEVDARSDDTDLSSAEPPTLVVKKKHVSVPNAPTMPSTVTSRLPSQTVDATKPAVLLRPKNINDLLEPNKPAVTTPPVSVTSSVTLSPVVSRTTPVTGVSPATAAMAKHSVNLASVSKPDFSLLPTKLTCSFCNSKFDTQTELISHLTSNHVPGTVQPSQEDLDNGHVTFVTAGKSKSMCLSCGKCFGKEAQVKIHLNVHFGDNIYTCRFCEKVFTNFPVFDVSSQLIDVFLLQF